MEVHIETGTKAVVRLAVALLVLIGNAAAAEPPPSSAEIAVRHLVDAFNAHDPTAMLTVCASDVRWMSVAGEVLSIEAKDAVALEQSMRAYFERVPSARSTLRKIGVSGPFVTTIEEARWESHGVARSQCSTAIYELRDDKIRNVWYFAAHRCD